MTARDQDQGPGPMRFRKMETALNRAIAVRERADRRIARLTAEMQAARQAQIDRLGLTSAQAARLTPVVLDIFDRIVERGDCWIWTGNRNNKGLPRMRDTTRPHPYPDRSACVLLDQALNGADGTGIRYPACPSGRDCVNPAHKRVRGLGVQMSGPGTFSRQPSTEAAP